MKQLSRDAWLAIGLCLVLLGLTLAAASRQTQERVDPPLASFSTAPEGARALQLWLEELGYATNAEPLPAFRIPEQTQLVLMLEPFINITPQEWHAIDEWVEQGGTLLLAGQGGGLFLAAYHYNFNLSYLTGQASALTPQTPLFTSPALVEPASVQTNAYFNTTRTDFVTHLAVPEGPVLLSFNQGAGRVILSAAPFPFSNAGLKEKENPALVLNILAIAGRPGTVWFDEWHHGLQAGQAEVTGFGNWLRRTPAGHALLYGALVIFVALALSGRHFGRPIPLPKEISRRAPLEYITAIANLNRRAGHRSAVLRQYHHRLKRGLGQRYRLDPTLPDEAYLAQLAQLKPDLDQIALRQLLARLSQRQVSEPEMIQLAAEVAHWLTPRT